MRFLNFELASPNHTIELRALGLNWELHNFAEFVGLQLMPEGSAVLTWIVSSETVNPWGGYEQPLPGLRAQVLWNSNPRDHGVEGGDASLRKYDAR